MLLFVQLVQISRAITTWENMKGSGHSHGGRASEAITSALTTGTTSMAGAQVGSAGTGPDPALPAAPRHHHHHEGCWAQWKKILGVDTFVETAMHGYEGRRNRRRTPENPFSRGVMGNCKDFWCDPAPIFGNRQNGQAMLGGEVINYTKMYDSPPRMSARHGAYESVAEDDIV